MRVPWKQTTRKSSIPQERSLWCTRQPSLTPLQSTVLTPLYNRGPLWRWTHFLKPRVMSLPEVVSALSLRTLMALIAHQAASAHNQSWKGWNLSTAISTWWKIISLSNTRSLSQSSSNYLIVARNLIVPKVLTCLIKIQTRMNTHGRSTERFRWRLGSRKATRTPLFLTRMLKSSRISWTWTSKVCIEILASLRTSSRISLNMRWKRTRVASPRCSHPLGLEGAVRGRAESQMMLTTLIGRGTHSRRNLT